MPCKLFSDNGSEFIGDDFVELCETFNIKATTTASYSQWSNGTCECYNQFITNMLCKIYGNAKCDYVIAFAWAINVKHSLINNNHGVITLLNPPPPPGLTPHCSSIYKLPPSQEMPFCDLSKGQHCEVADKCTGTRFKINIL